MSEKLLIIAGSGDLPRLLAEKMRDCGREVCILALRGYAGEWVHDFPHGRMRMLQLSKIYRFMKRFGAVEICMAGGCQRPGYLEVLPVILDFRAFLLAYRTYKLLKNGDNVMFSGLLKLISPNFVRIVTVSDVCPDFVASEGVIGAVRPSSSDMNDIERARVITNALGRVDVGQCAVVSRGLCLAVETIFGTDTMLGALAESKSRDKGQGWFSGGVMYKGSKPQQDLRIDMPTIGPETILAASKAGLRGVAVLSGKVLIIDAKKMINLADQHKIFLYGVPEIRVEEDKQ